MTSLPIAICFYADGDLLERTEASLSPEFTYRIENGSPKLEKAIHDWIKAYLAKKPIAFTGQLLDNGTPFQRSVWKEISAIPFGETISYNQLAERAGSPKGARAAGSACGRNQHILLIPCHRVIHASGKSSGFACDPEIKRRLLNFEKI